MTLPTQMLIDGDFITGAGEAEKVLNPSTGELLVALPEASADQVNQAVGAAQRAFESWSETTAAERAKMLLKLADAIEARAEEFARLESLNCGKPYARALGDEIPAIADCYRFFAGAARCLTGPLAGEYLAGHTSMVRRDPVGVVGSIAPWNYPLMMAAWKTAPALSAGNSVILKPAEQSPLSANLLAKLFMEAGGPAGVFNVIHGLGEEAGKALALHNDVDKIGFTGSTEVGKLMMVYAGQSNMKRVTTECGGKTPQIITGDVPDLDTAVHYAVNGSYGNQGEVCNAGSRLIVDAKIHDEFVSKFLDKAKKSFAPGDPLDPSTTMGPLVTKEQQKRVLSYIDIGKKEGAKLAMGGATPKGLDKGCYVSPTLFTGVKNDMRIAKEEIFGPVTGVLTYKKLDDAIAMANDSIYGLAASIWTSDVSVAHKAARDIEAGIVWVNCFDHGDMTSIWGGFKQSGMGRDKCLETLTTVTQTKSVWMHLG